MKRPAKEMNNYEQFDKAYEPFLDIVERMEHQHNLNVIDVTVRTTEE